jgi:hypothetical protein
MRSTLADLCRLSLVKMNKKSNNKLYVDVLGWILSKDNKRYSLPIIRAYSLSIFFLVLPGFGRQRKNNTWVVGSKIYLSDILFEECTLLSTPKDFKKLKCIPRYFFQFYRAYFLLYFSLLFKNPWFISVALKKIDFQIKKYTPKLIIINSTKDPFNRLIAYSAKKNNIKTVCIQHGLFSPTIPDEVNEDDLVDRYLAINENQKYIISRKISHEKIRFLSNSVVDTSYRHSKIKKICLIGEDWERYGYQLKKKIIVDFYFELVNTIKASNFNYLEFFYRPHPSECKFFGIEKLVPIEAGSVDQYDLFVGFSSTFLWDMASNDKLCLQVHSGLITDINFEDEQICASVKLDGLALGRIMEFIERPSVKYKINRLKLSMMLDFQ